MTPQESLLEYTRRIALDERTILNPLLESSNEFRAFYMRERDQLRTNIFWVWNESLEPINRLMDGELARANWIDENNVVIIFRNNPIQTSDASIIAHEIAHVIVRERGFPLVKTLPTFPGSHDFDLQVYTLNGMLHDPLVLQLLLSYGFNLTEEYENEARRALELMPEYAEPPTGTNLNNLILVYVQNHLQNQILFSDHRNPSVCHAYLELVGDRYPTIVVEGQSIIEFIERQGGYDIPEKVRIIYREIIQNRLGMDLFMSC